MVSKLVVQITPPLACMRFPVNEHPYHPSVSSVFIVLAILFYSVIFYFCIFWMTDDIDYFMSISHLDLILWSFCSSQSLSWFSFDLSFSVIYRNHLYSLDKVFYGKFFFSLKLFIGGMNGWITIYTFLIFLVLLDFAFPFVLLKAERVLKR